MANFQGKPKTIVYGVGINDVDYKVSPRAGGVASMCQFYKIWASMLQRCYSKKFHAHCPTYVGCSVCEEWHKFSNFKRWMEAQDWQGNHLDKDIILKGNKVYSPETCAFVSGMVNSFVNENRGNQGKYMIGVTWRERGRRFQATCKNPFKKKDAHVGMFDDELSAHLAWKARKHQHAQVLADTISDQRAAEALRNRYL